MIFWDNMHILNKWKWKNRVKVNKAKEKRSTIQMNKVLKKMKMRRWNIIEQIFIFLTDID